MALRSNVLRTPTLTKAMPSTISRDERVEPSVSSEPSLVTLKEDEERRSRANKVEREKAVDPTLGEYDKVIREYDSRGFIKREVTQKPMGRGSVRQLVETRVREFEGGKLVRQQNYSYDSSDLSLTMSRAKTFDPVTGREEERVKDYLEPESVKGFSVESKIKVSEPYYNVGGERVLASELESKFGVAEASLVRSASARGEDLSDFNVQGYLTKVEGEAERLKAMRIEQGYSPAEAERLSQAWVKEVAPVEQVSASMVNLPEQTIKDIQFESRTKEAMKSLPKPVPLKFSDDFKSLVPQYKQSERMGLELALSQAELARDYGAFDKKFVRDVGGQSFFKEGVSEKEAFKNLVGLEARGEAISDLYSLRGELSDKEFLREINKARKDEGVPALKQVPETFEEYAREVQRVDDARVQATLSKLGDPELAVSTIGTPALFSGGFGLVTGGVPGAIGGTTSGALLGTSVYSGRVGAGVSEFLFPSVARVDYDMPSYGGVKETILPRPSYGELLMREFWSGGRDLIPVKRDRTQPYVSKDLLASATKYGDYIGVSRYQQLTGRIQMGETIGLAGGFAGSFALPSIAKSVYALRTEGFKPYVSTERMKHLAERVRLAQKQSVPRLLESPPAKKVVLFQDGKDTLRMQGSGRNPLLEYREQVRKFGIKGLKITPAKGWQSKRIEEINLALKKKEFVRQVSLESTKIYESRTPTQRAEEYFRYMFSDDFLPINKMFPDALPKTDIPALRKGYGALKAGEVRGNIQLQIRDIYRQADFIKKYPSSIQSGFFDTKGMFIRSQKLTPFELDKAIRDKLLSPPRGFKPQATTIIYPPKSSFSPSVVSSKISPKIVLGVDDSGQVISFLTPVKKISTLFKEMGEKGRIGFPSTQTVTFKKSSPTGVLIERSLLHGFTVTPKQQFSLSKVSPFVQVYSPASVSAFDSFVSVTPRIEMFVLPIPIKSKLQLPAQTQVQLNTQLQSWAQVQLQTPVQLQAQSQLNLQAQSQVQQQTQFQSQVQQQTQFQSQVQQQTQFQSQVQQTYPQFTPQKVMRQPSRVDPPKPPKPEPPFSPSVTFDFRLPSFSHITTQTGKGFRAFARVRGEWVPVSGVLPRGRAMRAGKQFVSDTPARSFTIREVGVVQSPDVSAVDLRKFRARAPKSKIDGEPVWVEKTEYAIETPGERAGITAKGLKAIKQKRYPNILSGYRNFNKRTRRRK